MNERRALRLHDVMSFLPLCKSFFGEKNQTAEKEADGEKRPCFLARFPHDVQMSPKMLLKTKQNGQPVKRGVQLCTRD